MLLGKEAPTKIRQEIRYLARGVSGVPKEMQLRRWQLIDEKEKQAENKVDYLQIFEFNRDDHRETITIIHRQEGLLNEEK